MPTVFKTDANNDLVIENGLLVLVDGADSLEQRIKASLLLFQGEWFADTGRGVPWIQEVLVKNPDPAVLNAVFGDVIRGTQGVLTLDRLTFDLDNAARTLTIQFAVTADSGTISGAVVREV